MSLVEETQKKLRKLGAASEPRAAGLNRDVARAATEGPVVDTEGATVKAKRVVVDIGALRAFGCIAEETQGREFAGQYREIKRPLIERSLVSEAGESAREPSVIMVTSALPGDGKTFTSINLALSMARERDVSVLLVDADVQKADSSTVFGIRSERGLLDALVDETIDVESLVLRTNLPGLSLLSCGTAVEGATELLSSQRMRHIVAKLLVARHPRRIVLLDSPPLLITSEARSIIGIAGQAVVVIRAGKTPRRAVQDALALFEHQHVGLVLNHMRRGLMQGYYGYGYYGTELSHSGR